MARQVRNLIVSVFAIFVVGCSERSVVDEPVASVGDVVLTMSQLKAAIPATATPIDSAVLADEFIRRWVMDQVLYAKARYNLSEQEFDIEQEVESFRNALVVEKYQQKLIAQKFNPEFFQYDIERYYESMKSNFRLSENIVKCVFAVFDKNTAGLPQFLKTMGKYEDDNFAECEKFMFENAVKYDSSADKWRTLSSVKAFMPNDFIKNENAFLKSSGLRVFYDDKSCYVVKVLDYRLTDDFAPIEYVSDKIYAILLNKEKMRFLENVKRELYENALNSDVIKFYYIK